MKKINLFLGTILCAALFFSCASTSEGNVSNSKTANPKTANHPLQIDDATYSEMMKNTLVSIGNTYRLKKVIEKLRSGQEVYIAALGGSVTEGAGPANFKDGYAYQFNKKLKAEYTPDNGANVYFNDAGLSGTPSLLGLTRYQSDVVDVLGHNPDLLIVEFAVNDDAGNDNARAFEALVRDALLSNEETAVIALYSAATYGNTKNAKTPIASYYRIPQVDILDIVKAAVSKGTFKQEQYYTDTVHPTKEGHEIMADALMNLFAETDAAAEQEAYPVPEDSYKIPSFSNMIRISGNNNDVMISAGGFGGTDANCQSIKKTNKSNFPYNWYHSSSSSAESFTMDIVCKNLLLTYKHQGSWLSEKFGTAEVYVDGKKVQTLEGQVNGGWNDCVPLVIIDEKNTDKHHVEIKMASGSEKLGFTIVAMAYSK